MAGTTPRTRMSAEERRESVIQAALTEFARSGYHGTSTEVIARRVGVSQPYLFRLFPSKRALFAAAAQRCADRIAAAFEKAAEGLEGEEALVAMGAVYADLIGDRELLLMQLQMHVAVASADDPELSESIRRGWIGLWDFVRSRTGATDEEIRDFFGTGMLINTLVALGIPQGHRCWAGLDKMCDTDSSDPSEAGAAPAQGGSAGGTAGTAPAG